MPQFMIISGKNPSLLLGLGTRPSIPHHVRRLEREAMACSSRNATVRVNSVSVGSTIASTTRALADLRIRSRFSSAVLRLAPALHPPFPSSPSLTFSQHPTPPHSKSARGAHSLRPPTHSSPSQCSSIFVSSSTDMPVRLILAAFFSVAAFVRAQSADGAAAAGLAPCQTDEDCIATPRFAPNCAAKSVV